MEIFPSWKPAVKVEGTTHTVLLKYVLIQPVQQLFQVFLRQEVPPHLHERNTFSPVAVSKSDSPAICISQPRDKTLHARLQGHFACQREERPRLDVTPGSES